MSYADLLSNRPFQGGAAPVPNPYARLMKSIMSDISTFRADFPRDGGDGMKPQRGGMGRTQQPMFGYDALFQGGNDQMYQRRQAPRSQIVRSTFGG